MLTILIIILTCIIISTIMSFFLFDQRHSLIKWKLFTRKESIKPSFKLPYRRVIIGVIVATVSIVFNSFLIGLVLIIAVVFMSFVIKLKKEEIAKEQSSIIFKDFITSVSSSTKAGYSIINAFDKAEYETIKSHGDSKNVMLVYISKLNSELDLGFELDVALTNFENRCELNDVSTFCSNIKIINEKGGSVISIIDKVVQSILDRVRMRQEIKTLTAAKKLEATLLTWFPFVIGLALYLISPNYFEPLLESLMGQVLLFMAFVFLVLNGLISRKIVRIEI